MNKKIMFMFLFLVLSSFISASNYDYWREDTSTIWAKVNLTDDSILTIIINDTSTYAPDGENVFIEFDDFNDNSISGDWTVQDGNWIESSNMLSLSSGNPSNIHIIYRNNMEDLNNYILDFDGKATLTNSYVSWLTYLNTSTGNSNGGYLTNTVTYGRLFSSWGLSGTFQVLTPYAIGLTWHEYSIEMDGTKENIIVDDVSRGSWNDTTYSTGKVGLSAFWNRGVSFDNFRVREYTNADINISCNSNICNISSNENISNYQLPLNTTISTGNLRVFTEEVSNFEINAISFWDNSTISNFTASINGTNYTTTNGTIITPFIQSEALLLNITVFGNDWFSSFYSHNISNNLEAILKQTDITFRFLFSNGDLISTPINLTRLDINNSVIVTNGSENIFPNSGIQNFNVKCDNDVFAPFNISLIFSNLENNTYNFTVNETQNVLTFLDANNSNPINDSNVTIHFPSGYNLSLMTNESGQVSFSYIQNNVTEFGEYIFEVNKVGYVAINLTEEINISVVPFFKTYNLSRAKLTINIYDRVTGNLLTGVNVSVAFIGLFNESTTTGTIVKDNLTITGGDYLIYAGSDGYKTSVRSLTFTNQEEFTINFYIMNLSDPTYGNIFVTTSDSFFRDITGAKVELLQYIPDSLSYISVSECITNINAECSFAVELNTRVYYLRATSLIDGEFLVAETSQNGEIYSINNDIRDLIFYTRDEFIISPIDNLIYDIDESFINNVSQITIEFNSYDGSAIEVCIEYFLREGGIYTSVTGDTYCLISSSAIQNIDTSVTLNRSNNYEARVYIKQSSGDLVLQTYDYPSITSTSAVFNNDMKGAIIMIFWVMALAFCLHSKNITLWFVLAIILSWLEVGLFPTYTVVGVSVFKTIISGFTIMVARRRRD